jgi:hypothetical protein
MIEGRMLRYFLSGIGFLLWVLVPIWAQTHSLQTVRAFWTEKSQIEAVAQEMEPEHVDLKAGYLILEVTPEQVEWLTSLGFFIDVDWETTAFRNSIYQSPQPLLGSNGIPGFQCYTTVQETRAQIEDWAIAFPDLVQIHDIGDSWSKTEGLAGFDLQVLELTQRQRQVSKPKVFIITGLHARELSPVGLAMAFAEELLSGYGSDPVATYLLDEVSFHFLLQANPDGRIEAEAGSSWRKNVNDTTCTSIPSLTGTDLNRNFPFFWGCCNGSSGSGCSITYRGATPISEPETEAIIDYAATLFPDQKPEDPLDPAPSDVQGVFLDIHSYGEWILWPFGFDSTEAPNGIALQSLGRQFAAFNNYSPEKASQSFTTDGTTDDFAYGTFGVPAYTFEVGTAFFQDCTYFNDTLVPNNLPALYHAGLMARAPYLWSAGPQIGTTQIQVSASTVSVSGLAFDDGYNQSNGVEPTQVIDRVVFYLNLPPWRNGVGEACDPADGTFDTVSEAFTATLNTTSLPPGQHWVYLQSQDSLGNWGPVYPVMFEKPEGGPTASVTGTVTEALTRQPIQASLQAGNAVSEADPTGSFAITLIPGSYELTASGRPYLEETAIPFQIEAGQQIQLNTTAVPFCDLIVEDAESGAPDWLLDGWSIAGDTVETGDFAFDDSPQSSATASTTKELTSPIFDVTTIRQPELSFFHQFDLATGDQARLEVNANQSGWVSLDQFSESRPNFGKAHYFLPESDSLQFRFTLTTSANPGMGWTIDRITLSGASYQCFAGQAESELLAGWPNNGLSIADFSKIVGHLWSRNTGN